MARVKKTHPAMRQTFIIDTGQQASSLPALHRWKTNHHHAQRGALAHIKKRASRSSPV